MNFGIDHKKAVSKITVCYSQLVTTRPLHKK